MSLRCSSRCQHSHSMNTGDVLRAKPLSGQAKGPGFTRVRFPQPALQALGQLERMLNCCNITGMVSSPKVRWSLTTAASSVHSQSQP
jgi:hypothetical protein